ncbi:unnamed protein product [Arabis nemorensis]|uniref:Uncharacterized protein n=1 Tax=Arabis nemorensis TaxID=586526 RepID=A0A565BMX8_9BRAS|nr:unnamed protein product [Arabis nemorensis]
MMERAVNVEEGIIDEQVDLAPIEPVKLEGGINLTASIPQTVNQGKSNKRGRQNGRGMGRNAKRVVTDHLGKFYEGLLSVWKRWAC